MSATTTSNRRGLSRAEFRERLAQDLAWLLRQRPHPSRDHLEHLLRVSEEHWFATPSEAEVAEQRISLQQRLEQLRRGSR